MENNKELLVQFIERHAAFFDSWANLLIVLIFILVIGLIYISIARLKSVILKILIFLILLLPLIIMTFFTYLLNSPLKPFISSIATIQRAIGRQIPDFDFKNVKGGNSNKISDFKGQVIVLNFWGTYCGPCVEEFTDLKRLEELNPGEVVVIALSEETEEKISSFLEKHESPSITGTFSEIRWIDLQTFKPLTLFIDKEGIVRDYVFGKKDLEYFSGKVKEL